MKSKIIINCDLGEGTNNEEALMPYIQACNIACGGHTGDEVSMRSVMQLAKKHEVKIGAHPSYPDTENFGRLSLNISEEELIETIQSQLQVFEEIAFKENIEWQHIKPHGALYNDLAKDEKLTNTFLKAIEKYKQNMNLYVPYGSIIAEEAKKQGFKILYEAFADRAYNDDRSLVSRKLPNSVLTNKNEILNQVANIAEEGFVWSVQRNRVPIKATTFCVHSDTENSEDIVKFLYSNLQAVNIE
ncbi:5-oxoprolinase subunit PxpA [Galbibacter sp. BG1]|uniref:5-oxoprolinase subunit PxpA n=1 Tax=Galbibacter sp. BG1 TaxID=1170699 RepID=UPI0015BCF6D9|nr:5-oxoprolinase subunit PxpA [Galbibacter sp. BG1]QLE02994.1 5-oxoprolinase subunit PxpA [Galbibacter sp. BG1]